MGLQSAEIENPKTHTWSLCWKPLLVIYRLMCNFFGVAGRNVDGRDMVVQYAKYGREMETM